MLEGIDCSLMDSQISLLCSPPLGFSHLQPQLLAAPKGSCLSSQHSTLSQMPLSSFPCCVTFARHRPFHRHCDPTRLPGPVHTESSRMKLNQDSQVLESQSGKASWRAPLGSHDQATERSLGRRNKETSRSRSTASCKPASSHHRSPASAGALTSEKCLFSLSPNLVVSGKFLIDQISSFAFWGDRSMYAVYDGQLHLLHEGGLGAWLGW